MVKNLPANTGGITPSVLIPGLGRSPGEGNSNPLQHSCLENPMGRGTWRAIDHVVAMSWTQQSAAQHGCETKNEDSIVENL